MSEQVAELRPETVTVMTMDGQMVFHTEKVHVPLDGSGNPVISRVDLDTFNNLTVLVNKNTFQRFNANTWASVHVEPRIVIEAVKNAS